MLALIMSVSIASAWPLGSISSITSSKNPSIEGESVTFTVKVDLVEQNGVRYPAPDGSVDFWLYQNGNPNGPYAQVLGVRQVNNGLASITVSTLPVGSHIVGSKYHHINRAFDGGISYRSLWQTVNVNTSIPEFPTITLPIVAILGLIAVVGSKKSK